MLVPHGGENTEFSERRRAPYELQNALIFIWLKAMGRYEFRVDLGFLMAQGLHPVFPRFRFVPRITARVQDSNALQLNVASMQQALNNILQPAKHLT